MDAVTAAIALSSRNPFDATDALSKGKRTCKCRNSRCLQLYCECFRGGDLCDSGCSCLSCHNKAETEMIRVQAIITALDKKPDAFRPKESATVAKHSKGCRCVRSFCLKKYCECFDSKSPCTDRCRCLDCKNFEDRSEESELGSKRQRLEDTPLKTNRSRLIQRFLKPQSQKRSDSEEIERLLFARVLQCKHLQQICEEMYQGARETESAILHQIKMTHKAPNNHYPTSARPTEPEQSSLMKSLLCLENDAIPNSTTEEKLGDTSTIVNVPLYVEQERVVLNSFLQCLVTIIDLVAERKTQLLGGATQHHQRAGNSNNTSQSQHRQSVNQATNFVTSDVSANDVDVFSHFLSKAHQ